MTSQAPGANALFRLDGQAAIVTGAGAGIGRAIALMLAGAGAAVLAVDRDESGVERTRALIAESGGRASAIAADVSDAAATPVVVDRCVDQFGQLDVLVNNAGVYPPGAPLPALDQQMLDRTLDINFKATARYLSEAARRMRPGSRIINVSSVESLRPAGPGLLHYCASKAAVNALTRSGAVDLAPLGIRVNAILPGFVDTEGTRATPKEAAQHFAQRAPARRNGTPEDIAAAALYLASAAGAFVNGHCLVVDGGLTIAG
jgi:NAD(P)-dependent dehydrogenase (short-subunit alcohol dehydrogenase family)